METLLTKDDVCKMLSITEATLKRLMERRAIQYYKVGGRVRFTTEDVEEYVRRVRVPAAPLRVTAPQVASDEKRGVGRPSTAQQTGYTPGMRVV